MVGKGLVMTKTVSLVLAMAAVTSALAFPGAALASVDYSFLDDLSLDELTALQEEIDLRVEAGQADANANDVEDFGIWNIRYFVDEFDRPTDDGYVIALTKDGYFSNLPVDQTGDGPHPAALPVVGLLPPT